MAVNLFETLAQGAHRELGNFVKSLGDDAYTNTEYNKNIIDAMKLIQDKNTFDHAFQSMPAQLQANVMQEIFKSPGSFAVSKSNSMAPSWTSVNKAKDIIINLYKKLEDSARDNLNDQPFVKDTLRPKCNLEVADQEIQAQRDETIAARV